MSPTRAEDAAEESGSGPRRFAIEIPGGVPN